MAKKSRFLKRVEVHWIDSSGQSGWSSRADVDDYIKNSTNECRSIGYLLEANKRHVVLSCGLFEPHPRELPVRFDNQTKIPRVAVRKIVDLRDA